MIDAATLAAAAASAADALAVFAVEGVLLVGVYLLFARFGRR